MLQRAGPFRRLFLRRQRRFWRYVSPKRRGAVLVLLALLSGAVYGYWYQTNARHVRRLAEAYLRDLTGADVTVGGARFSLFGKIVLTNVAVRVPGDNSPDPLFRASRVLLAHRPWDTLFSRQLSAKEIICFEPVVTVEYYTQRGDRSNVAKFEELARMQRGPPGEAGVPGLPPIRVRRCTLQAFTHVGGRSRQGQEAVEVSLLPEKEGAWPELSDEQTGAGLQFRCLYDPASGKATRWTLAGPIRKIASILPPAYKMDFTEGTFEATWPGRCKEKKESSKEKISVTLDGVAVRLTSQRQPSRPGGSDLKEISGQLIFHKDKEKLEISKVTGQLASPGSGEFTLKGFIGTAGKEPAYKVDLHGDNLVVPPIKGKSRGELAEALRRVQRIQEIYNPAGKVGVVDVTLERKRGGAGSVRGSITADGISACYKHFPYPLEDVRGKIEFINDTVRFENLKAWRGPAKFTLSGRVDETGSEPVYDVTILSENLPMDDTLRKALRPGTLVVFDDLAPKGLANVSTRVSKVEGKPEETTLTFLPGAELTAAHRFFPYRVSVTGGCLYVRGGDVVLPAPREADAEPAEGQRQPIEASCGEMECVIYGRATGTDTDTPSVDLTIEADKVPLDDALRRALQPEARLHFAKMNPEGVLRDVRAKVTQRGGGDVDFDVSARLENVSFNYSEFPYQVRDAAGELTIKPDRILIKRLAGRHGRKTAVEVSGRVFLDQEKGGAELTVDASNLVFDKDLYAALGPGIQELWRQVAPAGTADIRISKYRYRENTPNNPGLLDYEIVIKPRDMTIGYMGLPYRFQIGRQEAALPGPLGQAGGSPSLIVARPGIVEMHGLRSARPRGGETLELLDGRIIYDDKFVDVKLALKASNLPLGAKQLKALQDEGFPLTGRLKPGGSFDIDLEEIDLLRIPPRDKSPSAESKVTARASGEGVNRLSGRGTVTLRDTVVGFGLGESKV
ncbi:MAG: hypothetical protein ACYTF6_08885, partial [Planctomycetota bacterium]